MRMARFGQVLAGAAAFLAVAGPASADDSWVFGSSLIALPDQVAYFARYVAPGAPGQIVVRCDTVAGVSIDAGAVNMAAAANAAPSTPGAVSVRLTWPAEGANPARVETIDATGEQRIRSDGAIIVTFAGPAADLVAKGLAEPLEKVEVLVGEVAADIALDGIGEVMETLSRACKTWPR
ncbi:MAG: hypothetical protein IT535_03065 [Bauldia sp.]|nr:hypothetical protein [Bauldia sp.]